MKTLLNQYQNGQTTVSIYSDGTKVRDISNGGIAEFPESMDVKITNWCEAACAYCHENSTKLGSHGDLTKTIDLIKQLPAGVEIAIGGGHAMAHPEFDNFVTELSSHGIICNVTVNEFHFNKELPRIEKLVSDGKIKGVGYSFSKIPCDWEYEHLVNHVIIGVTPYSELKNIIRTNKKVLLLGYKFDTGRGKRFHEIRGEDVDRNISSWYHYLFSVAARSNVSFDNLAITQLKPMRLFFNQDDYDRVYMGDDGHYSMYIDAVKQEYTRSSTAKTRFGFGDKLDIRKYFKEIRDVSC